MDEDTVMELLILVGCAIGALVGIGVIGFICWCIYRLVIQFL